MLVIPLTLCIILTALTEELLMKHQVQVFSQTPFDTLRISTCDNFSSYAINSFRSQRQLSIVKI